MLLSSFGQFVGIKRIARITKTFAVARGGNDPELGGVGYGVSYPIFWIDVFYQHGTKQQTASRARSRGEVDFHRAAFSSGGQDNGGPGLRSGNYPLGYFAAFVLDPDGNNIEAVFRESGHLAEVGISAERPLCARTRRSIGGALDHIGNWFA